MASPSIILVRHAMSDVDRALPSREWGITPGAVEDSRRMARALTSPPAAIASSAEPKAHQTAAAMAEVLALPVTIDDRLGEVDRPTTWDGDYRAQAAAYLAGTDHPSWEPRAAVLARFSSGVEAALERASGDGGIVIVNHGLALSLYLANQASIDILAFWTALRFPDAWRWNPAAGSLDHVFSDGVIPPDA